MDTCKISFESFCGHCNLPITLDAFARHTSPIAGQTTRRTEFYTGICPKCGKPIIHNYLNNSVLPTSRGFENIKHLPKDVETLYNEIRDAFSMNAFTCCVIAGRTLLANVAVEQGAKDGESFTFYVDYMVSSFMPHNSSKPWIDKVRSLGNNSAHKLVIGTKENAETSLKFLVAILKIVYEFPNSV